MTDWSATVIVQGPDDGALVVETTEPGETALVAPPDAAAVTVTGNGADGSQLVLDPGGDVSVDVSEGQPDETIDIVEGQDPTPLVVEIGILREVPAAPHGVVLAYDGNGDLTTVTRDDGIELVLTYDVDGDLLAVDQNAANTSPIWTKDLFYDGEDRLDVVALTIH